jgi:uncharacterized protein (DUF4415 family)
MKKEYDFSKGKRGALVKVPPERKRVTISIDSDILDWFSEQIDAVGGGSFQAMINEALREYIAARREPLEETLRRVVREEIQSALPSH